MAARRLVAATATPLLQITNLHAGYGKVGVLHGVDLQVGEGEIVALLGPNGAGKSTLLRAISGLLPSTGTLHFDGEVISTPRAAVAAGLVHVVEGHRVFTALSVADNLLLAGYGVPKAERARRVEQALATFPEIAAKRHEKGGALSGGQQQMLAVAQGLVQQPRLMMLDEPSAGLSPVLVDRVLAVLAQLRQAGTAVLLVEQLTHKAAALADRVCALARGRIVLDTPADAPGLHARLERAYMGATA